MVIRKKNTIEEAEKAIQFLKVCQTPGNEGYLRAFYYWLRNRTKRLKQFSKITHYDIEVLMCEYVSKGLNTKTTDDKTLISDNELRFFQSNP